MEFRKNENFVESIKDRRSHIGAFNRLNEKYSQQPFTNKLYQIRYEVLNHSTLKLWSTLDEISKSKPPTILIVSSIRFVFEQLITYRLLNKDEKHFYRFYISGFRQLKLKVENKIKRAVYEIRRKKELSLKVTNNKVSLDEHNPERITRINKQFFPIRKEISFFSDYIDDRKILDLAKDLENNLIPNDEKYLEQIDLKINEELKELFEIGEFRNLFGIGHQFSSIISKLKYHRSWKEKAALVGLTKEYEFIYEYTSSMIHFTSFSALSSPLLTEMELTYHYKMIDELTDKICQELQQLVEKQKSI
jgi:hypothetical protein